MNQANPHTHPPIVAFLRRWIPAIFPTVRVTCASRSGVRACVRHLIETRSFSMRSADHAADIYVDASDLTQRHIGDGLFALFVEWHADLGVDQVIWNGQIWTKKHNKLRAYCSAQPHPNRIHVAFTRAASQQQPTMLVPLLDGLYLDVYGTLTGRNCSP